MASNYIISCDLHKRMAQLRQVGIRINDACLELTKEFQSGLQELAQECYPQDKILLLDIDSMSAEVLSLVNSIADNRDILVLSTSVDFSVPRRGYVLEVNRLINEDGEIIGIGARPGHHGLDTQFDYISKAASGRPVILVDGKYPFLQTLSSSLSTFAVAS